MSFVNEPKFVVFWSCIMTLFELCSKCFKRNFISSVTFKGTLLTIKTNCINNHIFEWRSQPFSGNTFARITEMLKMINVVHISRSRFFEIQKTLLFPAMNKYYKNSRVQLYDECLKSPINHFSGDGRCDSPGYSAKYGTYSLMNTETNKIIDFQVVYVSTAGNSNLMEKTGLQILLEKFTKLKIPMTSLTTDRHIQVRAFMKKYYPSISHQFDIWHFAKSVKKKLSKLAKGSTTKTLNPWIKSVINHLWWSCATWRVMVKF